MLSTRPRLGALAAVLALALVPSGCGSDSGGSEPLSKQEYGKQFNSVGKQFLDQIQRLQKRLGATTDTGKRAAALGDAKNQFAKLSDRLEKIKAPKAIAGAQQKFVAKLREITKDLADLRSGFAAKSREKVRAVALRLQSDGNEAKRFGGQIDDYVK